MRSIVIVGGGISGLATAYFIQKQALASGVPISCSLVESSPDFGGKIATRNPSGFVIEGGPDSILTQKPWALDLCRELGLTDRLVGTNPSRQPTSVLVGNRLIPLPEGAMLGVPTRFWPFIASPLISWPGKLRMAFDLVIPPRRLSEDESVGDFIRRRLGREAVEKIAEPLMAGIHVADPDRLSLRATFPRFAEMEQRHGSLIRGLRLSSAHKPTTAATSSPVNAGSPQPVPNGTSVTSDASRPPATAFVSFREGMHELVDALVARLHTVSRIHGRRVVQLARRPAVDVAGAPTRPDDARGRSGFVVQLDDGSSLYADAVVLATPAYVSAELVASFNSSLASDLSRIRYVSTATVSLGYRRADVAHPLDGFGFVVPRGEKRKIVACTWASTKFDGRAPPEHVLIRAFAGGSRDESIVDLNDGALIDAVRKELDDVLGVTAKPVVGEVFRWRKGIPQYDVGHLDRIAALDEHLDQGLFLAGAAYRGVGVPDCIHGAEQVAEKAFRYLAAHQSVEPESTLSTGGGI